MSHPPENPAPEDQNALWILWNPRRQCLHDKAAKIVIAKVSPGDPDPYATTTY
jgi:hypothetical protein